jgi:DNA repair protein RadC
MTFETILTGELDKKHNIASAEDVYIFAKNNLDLKREQIVLLTLDDLSRVIGHYVVHIGKIKSEMIDQHLIFYKTILDKSSNIIICYIKESGITEPSPRIYKIASSLNNSAKILEIKISFQLILAENSLSRIKYDINDYEAGSE